MLMGVNLYGATYTVLDEDGLILAIGLVNSSGTDDTIIFSGNIVLEAELPEAINKGAVNTLTIEGNGHTLSRDPSASAFRVLTINAGNVTIDRLTISGGDAGTEMGGGILNDSGTLALTNCTVSGNIANYGGGIFKWGAC